MTDQADSAAPPRFFAGLESLRGIAALMVALYHPAWQSHIVRWNLVRNGSLMVDFFFVLSGFVLFHSYGGKLATWADSRRFLLIRLGRLYPLHLAVLLVFVGIEWLKWGLVRFHLASIASIPFAQNTPASLIGNLLLIHGLGFYGQPTWNVPSWSISVEFYIYGLFALIVVLFRKKPFLLVSCAALATTGLLVSWTAAGGLDSTAKYGFFRGLLGFFCGVIAWHCYSALRGRFGRRSLAGAAMVLGVSTIALLSLMRRGPSDFLCIPLFVGIVLVVALADAYGLGFLNSRALVWLGTISYSVYLVHPLINWGFETLLFHVLSVPRQDLYQNGMWTGDFLTVAYVVIVLMVSAWTFRHIEDRFRRKVKRAVDGPRPAVAQKSK